MFSADVVAPQHRTLAELDAALDHIRRAPVGTGTVELLVRRPRLLHREVLEAAELDPAVGVVGDTWAKRPSRRSIDGGPHPLMQLNIMSSRAIAAICPDPALWPLAGDQLYVDMALGADALPAGTQLAIGTAVIEVTAEPHRGCAKFSKRFGADATRWVNTPAGIELNLRGHQRVRGRARHGGRGRPRASARRQPVGIGRTDRRRRVVRRSSPLVTLAVLRRRARHLGRWSRRARRAR